MTIDRLGQYGGLYQNYKVPDMKQVDTQQVTEPKEVKDSQESRRNEYPDAEQKNRKQQSRISDLENISLTFNKEDFDYLGKDSEIGNLDVQKAVSDMRKDQILEEYQYFIGSLTQDISMQDGIVIQK